MARFGLFTKSGMDEGVAEYRQTSGAVLLDVRTREEYEDGHIDGSRNRRCFKGNPQSEYAAFRTLQKRREERTSRGVFKEDGLPQRAEYRRNFGLSGKDGAINESCDRRRSSGRSDGRGKAAAAGRKGADHYF